MRGHHFFWGACFVLALITTGGCEPPDERDNQRLVEINFDDEFRVQPKGVPVAEMTPERTRIEGQRTKTPIRIDRERTPIKPPTLRHVNIMETLRAMQDREPVPVPSWRPVEPDIELQPEPEAPDFRYDIFDLPEPDDDADFTQSPMSELSGFLDDEPSWMVVDLSTVGEYGDVEVVRWVDGRKWTDRFTQRAIQRNPIQRIPSGKIHVRLTSEVMRFPAHWRQQLPEHLEAVIQGAMPDRLDEPIDVEPERIGLATRNFRQALLDIQPLTRERIILHVGDAQRWVPVARFRITNRNGSRLVLDSMSFGEVSHHGPGVNVRRVPPLFTGQCRVSLNNRLQPDRGAWMDDGNGLDGQQYAAVEFGNVDDDRPILLNRNQRIDLMIECLTSEDIGDECRPNPFAEPEPENCGLGPNGERVYKYCALLPDANWNGSRFVFEQEASTGGTPETCNDSGTIEVRAAR